MKNRLIGIAGVALLSLFSIESAKGQEAFFKNENNFEHSQKLFFKNGLNVYSLLYSHKSGNISFPSWEVSCERMIGKRFSFTGDLDFSKQNYLTPDHNWFGTVFGNTRWQMQNYSIITGARYYPEMKENAGFFFQIGIPVTYTSEKDYYIYPSGTGVRRTDGFSITTLCGFGVKHWTNSNVGVELSIGISPPLNFLPTYDSTSGYFRTGIMIFWAPKKVKKPNNTFQHQ